MDLQIHNIKSSSWKTIYFKQGIAFISRKEIKSIEAFDRLIKNPSKDHNIEAFPESNIISMSYTDKSKLVDINYIDKNNLTRKVTVNLGHKNFAREFAEGLGEKLKLAKGAYHEKNWKSIIFKIFYIILFSGLSIFTIPYFSKSYETALILVSLLVIGIFSSVYGLVNNFASPPLKTEFIKSESPNEEQEEKLKLKLPLLRRS